MNRGRSDFQYSLEWIWWPRKCSPHSPFYCSNRIRIRKDNTLVLRTIKWIESEWETEVVSWMTIDELTTNTTQWQWQLCTQFYAITRNHYGLFDVFVCMRVRVSWCTWADASEKRRHLHEKHLRAALASVRFENAPNRITMLYHFDSYSRKITFKLKSSQS